MSEPLPQQETNNTLLMKINVLKNGFLEERKKNATLTSSNTTLKEELTSKENELIKVKEQGNEKEEEFNKTKEQLVLKEEQYNKGKEKLGKMKDTSTSGKHQIKSFFTGFGADEVDEQDELGEEPTEEVETINYQKLNEELTEQFTALKNEKNKSEEKLGNAGLTMENLKEDYEKKIKEIESNSLKEIEEKKNELEIENRDGLSNLNKQIQEKEKTINDTHQRMIHMSDLFKNYDVKYIALEQQVNEYKSKYETKSQEATKLIQGQNKLLEKIDELQIEVEELKIQGRAFKSTIEDLIPIEINFLFCGNILAISDGNATNNVFTTSIDKQVEICFGKVKHSLCFKEGEEKEQIFTNKEIITIAGDKKSRERVVISGIINGNRKNYLCLFKAKEVEYILKFYTRIKYKPNFVDNALMNVSMGDYGY